MRASFILLLFLPIAACGPGKDHIVEQKVAERVAEFTRKKNNECREALLGEAGQQVDSMLLHEALGEVNDSLARLLPFRPLLPAPIQPIDSATVKPIFDQQ